MTPHSSLNDRSKPERFAEVDGLKAIGILAVVLIHSTRSFWDPSQSLGEHELKQVLRFAVPGFLAVSGFLYATDGSIPLKLSLDRLRRVLFPYFVASISAEAFWAIRGAPHDLATIGYNLAIANSFGQYYYVFVLLPLVLVSPLLVKLPRRLLWILFLGCLVLQGLYEMHVIGGFNAIWRVRNPIMWWPYFLMGWLARLHYQRLRAWVIHNRSFAGIMFCIGVLACWQVRRIPELSDLESLAGWVGIFASIGLIFVLSCGREVNAFVRWLSEATYAIYLFHLFFVVPGVASIRAQFGAFEPLTIASIWCIGLIGSVGIVVIARTALGDRSRDVVGA
jgi:surface polysaccharide O-acyltransferase-like enzyme